MRFLKPLASVAGFALMSCSPPQSLPTASADKPDSQSKTECEISKADKVWLDASVHAWHFTSEKIAKVGIVENLTAIFFDKQCMLLSTNAMNAFGQDGADFQASLHHGTVKLSNGTEVPVGPTSFSQAADGDAFFVMSLPSVWREGKVDPGNFGLEGLMTAVLLHEATHVFQSPTYGVQIEKMSEAYNLPEDFADDSIQYRFKTNPEFVSSMEKEIELFFRAASAADLVDTKRLAREGLKTMAARRARWFVGDDVYLNEAEDLWLNMEGSGQWAGYSYLIHPQGAGLSQNAAMEGFGTRGGWWTQDEGLGIALTLEKLGYDWKKSAFGGADKSLTEMLKTAVK